MKSRFRFDAGGSAVIALSFATSVVALFVGATARYREAFTDETVYRLLARNLLDHLYFGYSMNERIAYRAPGYPVFDAAIRAINNSATSIRVLQAVLAGVTVWLSALIAKRLFGSLAAVVTAALLFVTGTLATYASFELSETLSTVLLVGAIALLVQGHDRASWRWPAFAGAALGLSTLARPQTILLAVPLAGALWLIRRGRSGLRFALVFSISVVLVLVPWTIRNAVRLDAFVPVSTYGGVNLYLANNPNADGRFHRADLVAGSEEYARITAMPEAAQDREWYDKAFRYMREHPRTTLRNWARNIVFFVRLPEDLVDRFYLATRTGRIPRLDDRVLWILALPGLIAAARRKDGGVALLPAIAVGYFMMFFMLYLPLPRFRHGVIPFLAVYSGAAIALLVSPIERRLSTREVPVS